MESSTFVLILDVILKALLLIIIILVVIGLIYVAVRAVRK